MRASRLGMVLVLVLTAESLCLSTFAGPKYIRRGPEEVWVYYSPATFYSDVETVYWNLDRGAHSCCIALGFEYFEELAYEVEPREFSASRKAHGRAHFRFHHFGRDQEIDEEWTWCQSTKAEVKKARRLLGIKVRHSDEDEKDDGDEEKRADP